MLNMHLEDQAGDVLKKFRYGRKLSLRAVAEAAEISTDLLRSLEAGESAPKIQELIRLGVVLGFDGESMASLHLSEDPPPGVQLSSRIRPLNMSYGGYAVRCALVRHTEDPRRALLVDTGGGEGLEKEIVSEGVTLEAILLTHGHEDHGGGWSRFQGEGPIPTLLSREDHSLLEGERGMEASWQDPIEGCLALEKKGWKVSAMRAPGHTRGSVAYLMEGALFVGDTLFCGSAGRARTPEDFPEQLESIRQILSGLPDKSVIIPGHGPLTTARHERAINPFVRTRTPSLSGP